MSWQPGFLAKQEFAAVDAQRGTFGQAQYSVARQTQIRQTYEFVQLLLCGKNGAQGASEEEKATHGSSFLEADHSGIVLED